MGQITSHSRGTTPSSGDVLGAHTADMSSLRAHFLEEWVPPLEASSTPPPATSSATSSIPLPAPPLATPHTDALLARRARMLNARRLPTEDECLRIVRHIIEYYLAFHSAVTDDDRVLRDASARGAGHLVICAISVADLQQRFEEYDPSLYRSPGCIRYALCHFMSQAGNAFGFVRCANNRWQLRLLL